MWQRYLSNWRSVLILGIVEIVLMAALPIAAVRAAGSDWRWGLLSLVILFPFAYHGLYGDLCKACANHEVHLELTDKAYKAYREKRRKEEIGAGGDADPWRSGPRHRCGARGTPGEGKTRQGADRSCLGGDALDGG